MARKQAGELSVPEAVRPANDTIVGRTEYMDWRPASRDGHEAVEWTWEGGDGADGTPLTGRGWAKLEDGDMNGMIVIHLGDESGFMAKRATATKSAKRRKRGG